MKMSSWIFLLISALLIVSGLFLCNYARSVAPSDEAIDGTYTSEDGQSLSELDYTDMNISTVSLALENCQVEVRGSAKEASVQMIGFKPNSFINSISNKTLRVSNQISLLDYLNLDGTGVTFSGVWQTLLSFTREEAEEEEEPKVILNIPDDFDIKQYSFSFTNCSVRLLDIGGESDLTLYSLDSAIEINNVNASLVDFETEESELSIMNTAFTHFELKSEGGEFNSNALKSEDIDISGDEGDFKMQKTDFREFRLDMDTCTILLESTYTQGSYLRDIAIEKGDVYLGDLLLGNEDRTPEDETSAPGSLSIALKEGKVTTQYGSEMLKEAVEDEENSSENGENSSAD